MSNRTKEWENISANGMTDNILIANIYKQLIQLNIKNKQPDFKQGQNSHFSKEEIQMANKYVTNKCSTQLTIREMQIKTTMRYITSHLTAWLSSKRTQITRVGEDVEKGTLTHCWWECNWRSRYRNCVEVSQETKNRATL